MNDLLLDKRAAAKALAVSVRTIERMIADKQLPAIRVRGRVRVPKKFILEFADAGRVARSEIR
jgi:excisionase family DNA binding protein